MQRVTDRQVNWWTADVRLVGKSKTAILSITHSFCPELHS